MTRIFTLTTTPSNQQNLLLTMAQVRYLLEVFMLVHYGPPSTENPTTAIVRCHYKQLNLFNKYLLLVTFETNDNYSIRFEMKKKTLFIQHYQCWQCQLRSAQVHGAHQAASHISALNFPAVAGTHLPTPKWWRIENCPGCKTSNWPTVGTWPTAASWTQTHVLAVADRAR